MSSLSLSSFLTNTIMIKEQFMLFKVQTMAKIVFVYPMVLREGGERHKCFEL
jgi:hypothetical protein